jgi:branched-subunit amino acid transport protein
MTGEHAAIIFAAAVITFATRLTGLSLGERTIPFRIRELFDRVPVAVFAALAAPGIAGSDVDISPRLAGAFVAVIAYLLARQYWIGLLAGMVGYGLARWIV